MIEIVQIAVALFLEAVELKIEILNLEVSVVVIHLGILSAGVGRVHVVDPIVVVNIDRDRDQILVDLTVDRGIHDRDRDLIHRDVEVVLVVQRMVDAGMSAMENIRNQTDVSVFLD